MDMTCLPGGASELSKIDGDANVEVWRAGKFAVLGIVEGAFEIVDARADMDASGERGMCRRLNSFERA